MGINCGVDCREEDPQGGIQMQLVADKERREAVVRRELGTGHCMTQEAYFSCYLRICTNTNQNQIKGLNKAM